MKLKKVTFWRMNSLWGEKEENYLDMLRYDLAFVRPAGDGKIVASVVAFPTFAVNRQGTCGGYVTHARWKSFGITLTPVTGSEADDLRGDFSGGWVTALHPRGADGKPDYGELATVSLDRVLATRDLFEAAKGAGGR